MKNLVFLFLILPGIIYGKGPFLGAIPVQYVSPGEELVIDTHRFFQPATNEKLEFTPNKDVDLSIDDATFQLRARASKPGLFDIVLSDLAGAKTAVVTLACAGGGMPSHHFVFKPNVVAAAVPSGSLPPETAAATHNVFIAGSFNGWNATKNPLTGPNENGEYSIDLPLAPGRYSYKFVVDGKWMLDPANSETEDNGLGDKNSVVTIKDEEKRVAATIFADRLDSKILAIRAASDKALKQVSAIFESDAGSESIPAKIENDKIEVTIPQNRSGFVRVIAKDGREMPTNVVRCAVCPKTFHWQDAIM